jgi:hypothetical protein
VVVHAPWLLGARHFAGGEAGEVDHADALPLEAEFLARAVWREGGEHAAGLVVAVDLQAAFLPKQVPLPQTISRENRINKIE